MGARRYRVAVGAAAVVAVLEWRRMKGVGAASDVSDGWRRVGSDVSDVGGQRMWCRGGGGRSGVEVGSDVSDAEVRVRRMWHWSGGGRRGVGVAAGVEAMRWRRCS